MRRWPIVAVALLLAALPWGRAVAVETVPAGGTPLSIEQFLQIPVLLSPRLSPDGRRVAYLRRWRDLEEDTYHREIWVADLKRGTQQRISYDDGVVGGLGWRPDGALSYLARRGDGAEVQVWINPLDGSEPRAVTDMPHGVSLYRWAPDGVRLALLSRGEPADGDSTTAAEDEEEDADRADWTVFDRLEHPEDYDQVWVVTTTDEGPADAEKHQLTRPPLHPYDFAWSPDGTMLALTYNERFSSLVDEEQRVGLLNVESGALTMISNPRRHASLARFSPDGRRLAFYMDQQDSLRAYLNLKDVVVYDLETGELVDLTPTTQLTLGGSGSTPSVAPIWAPDGRRIYVPGAWHRELNLYRLDARHPGEPELWLHRPGNLGALDAVGERLVYTESELHRPGSIWTTRLGKPTRAQLVDSVDDAVADLGLVAPQPIELPGADGLTVEGFLFLPPGRSVDDGPLPTIVEMHGGPYYRYGNAWTTRYPWHVLAHHGYAVAILNPRGGTGYGVEFLRGVYRNFGTDDFRDLMAACDALVERGIADPDRMGFTGYSYGGLSTDNVVSRTDRFRAAVSIAGIWNYVSAMGENNPQLFIDSYHRPWADDLQRMWEHSPASRAANIRTPTLLMHGTEDEPVDPRQSIEMFTYLQLNGVPSRLVLYPGEGHGINKPSHMLDYETRELQWFDYYVMGDAAAAGAEPPVPVEPPARR